MIGFLPRFLFGMLAFGSHSFCYKMFRSHGGTTDPCSRLHTQDKINRSSVALLLYHRQIDRSLDLTAVSHPNDS